MSPTTARISPLSPPYDRPVADQLAWMMPVPDIEPIALFRTVVRNLPMAKASWTLGAYGLGRDLTLTKREREILIDRTSVRLGCEYEWGVHVAFFGPRVALTPGQVTSLTHGDSADDCWDDERERLVIETVDALTGTADIDDELWDRLAARFDEAELLDLLLVTGWYHSICFVARALRIPNEPGCPTFAEVAP